MSPMMKNILTGVVLLVIVIAMNRCAYDDAPAGYVPTSESDYK